MNLNPKSAYMARGPEPYYQDDLVTLYNCDYREGMDESLRPDAIVTDPPYGETSLDWDIWPTGWLIDAFMMTKNLWCFGSFRMFMEHADEFAPWKLAEDLVWEKQNGSGFHNDRFKRVHEQATHWYHGVWGDLYNEPPTTPDAVKKIARAKKRPTHMGQIERTAYQSEDGGDRLMRSVIKLRNMHGRAINETEKPVQLVGLLVQASVPPGGLVVDLFAGSGSTGVAARQQGKKAVLFEKRESQCEVTALRLERETAQPLDFGALA
jgi:site-specific DNA-methyltransferase (adenine-specific)